MHTAANRQLAHGEAQTGGEGLSPQARALQGVDGCFTKWRILIWFAREEMAREQAEEAADTSRRPLPMVPRKWTGRGDD